MSIGQWKMSVYKAEDGVSRGERFVCTGGHMQSRQVLSTHYCSVFWRADPCRLSHVMLHTSTWKACWRRAGEDQFSMLEMFLPSIALHVWEEQLTLVIGKAGSQSMSC